MEKLSAVILLALCCVAMVTTKDVVPTPPTFPSSFTVQFLETLKVGPVTLARNNGTWYYDWTDRRARFDHLRGQLNNFCAGQGLSPKDPKAPCQLFFTPSGDMFVHYPEAKTCCLLCGKDQGCTILKPDWLKQDTKLLYTEMINGDVCYGFGRPGAVAAEDVMYSDVSGFLCRYHEVVHRFEHNLTYYRDSFNFGPIDPAIFTVPEYCTEKCPHPYIPPSYKYNVFQLP